MSANGCSKASSKQANKTTRSLGVSALSILVGLLSYLFFWPVPVNPQSWSAPVAPDYVGHYAANAKLASFDSLSLAGEVGPEGVVVGHDGSVYAATEAGWIIRWRADRLTVNDLQGERWVNTGGRPLGLSFGPQGNLWVADAFQGILRINSQGEQQLMVSQFNGQPLRYSNDLTFAANGLLYFTDSTQRFSAKSYGSTYKASLIDLMEHGSSGRVLEYNPATGGLRQLFSGLSFANGIAVDPQGQFLLVNETGAYRVWKHWLAGPKAGESEVLIDNLPGFPDNLYVGGVDGWGRIRYWLGFTSPRLALVDAIADKPFVRRMVQRLPSFVRPKAQHYGHVIAISGEGEVLANLQDPNAAYPLTTGVAETEHYLYISSLAAPVLARVDKRSGALL